MLKIVADENIIFARGAFSHLGEVVLLPGREISRARLVDADILLVRSVTKVDENLLDNTGIKFVGTATIGSDHVDKQYLGSRGIKFTDASGCNADAVAEYVFSALFDIASEMKFNLCEKSIGVIGVGNIGSRVSKFAASLGMKVLKNDPPLKREPNPGDYLELDELMNCDIITLHVPLNMKGIDRTFHLFDKQRLEKIKNGAILINASRGLVIDNNALTDIIQKKDIISVLDVWENEPEINVELLQKTKIGTPHIAGYSYEGKVNGTSILYNAVCNFLKINPVWKPVLPEIDENKIRIINRDINADIQKIISEIYKIKEDDKQLREIQDVTGNERGKYFDGLRKNYRLRREFSNYFIKLKNDDKELERILRDFRFKVIN